MIFTKNISVLLEKPTHFFPNQNDNFEEQMNSIMRASIYIGIIITLYRRSLTPLLLPIFVALCIYIVNELYRLRKKKELKEKFSLTGVYEFRKPTKDNPYMNYLLTNLHDDQQNPKNYKKKSCPLYDQQVSLESDTLSKSTFFNDVDDIYNHTQSQRQFVTFGNNDVVNNRDGLLKWLSKDSTHCKDNNGDCYRGI